MTTPPDSSFTRQAECERCHEALLLIRPEDGRMKAVELMSGEEHVCWPLPETANLLVLDD